MTQPTLMTYDEMTRILHYKPHEFIADRTWVLILFLLDSGARIDEALRVEHAHVNLERLCVKVLGKGNKERTVPMTDVMRRVLYRWMEAHPHDTRLFATRQGRPLAYRNVHRDIVHFCERLGIQTKVYPHLFRHHFASHFIACTGDIYRLSRILGHTSIVTTQLYLRSLGAEALLQKGKDDSPLQVAVPKRVM